MFDIRTTPAFIITARRVAGTRVRGDEVGSTLQRLDQPRGITNPSVTTDGSEFLIAARTVSYRLSRLRRRGVPLPGSSRDRTVILRCASTDDHHATDPIVQHSEDPIVVGMPRSDVERNHEDPRLFRWRDAVWALWTASLSVGGGRHENTMVLGRLSGAEVHDVIELPSPVGASREKNWMPLVQGDRLLFVYDLGRGLVYEFVEGGSLELVAEQACAELAGESGSSQFIPYRDGWLGVSHHRLDRPYWLAWLPIAYYRHRLVLLNDDLSVRRVSKPFFFSERNVEFCAGIAPDEDSIVFSFGVEDERAALLRLHTSRVDALLGLGAGGQN